MSIVYDANSIVGYGDGLIKSDELPAGEFTDRGDLPKGNRKNYNLWFYLDNKRYNVHPYRRDLCGWPVRWVETYHMPRA